jgi:3-oxoadipate enol-lactonase
VSGSLHVVDAGAGPAVLAVHGLGGGAWFFAPLAELLRHRLRLLAVDLPGTGRSAGTSGPMSIDGWVAELGDLIDERVPASDQVVLLGHSMGTIVALQAWRAWPGRIRGLVLIGGLPRARPLIRDRLMERLAGLEHAGSLAGWGSKVSPGVFSPATFRANPKVVADFEAAFEAQPVDSYRRSIRVLLDADASGIAGTVTVPTLILSGADDQYAPPDLVHAFAAEFPAPPTVEILPDTGHVPFLEHPGRVAAAVAAFASGAAGPSSG